MVGLLIWNFDKHEMSSGLANKNALRTWNDREKSREQHQNNGVAGTSPFPVVRWPDEYRGFAIVNNHIESDTRPFRPLGK